MTGNQIAYWSLQEAKRHNLEDESIKFRSLTETERHNLATESNQEYANMTNYYSYLEGARANRAREAENLRHNTQTEALGFAQHAENVRHNIEGESISWFNAEENKRHNVEGENINWFNAQENQRHNVEGEKISWFNAEENQRHNKEGEQISWFNVEENKRHNEEGEAISWATQKETAQHYARQDSANALNAKTNERNAATNEQNAATNWYNALVQSGIGEALVGKYNSEAALNRAKTQGQAWANLSAQDTTAWQYVSNFTPWGWMNKTGLGEFTSWSSQGFKIFWIWRK